MPHKKVEALQVEGYRRGKGKPKKCLAKTLRNHMTKLSLSSLLALNRAMWRERFMKPTPNNWD